MKIFITTLLFILHFQAFSQVIAGFENFNLPPGRFLNNASPEVAFQSGSILLPNYYDEEFDFWSGFAISTDTNTTTPGFLNQYSAYPGSGAAGTTAYAMGYIYQPLIIRLAEQALGKPMIGMYVANSTYAFLSMRDGDAFAKKFGGETGADPDYFLFTIKKYSGGVIDDDSLNVYLADYRSPNSAKDYILEDWKYIDLTVLGQVDSLEINLRSSDNGLFGMNTPAYVAIDQISTDNLLSAEVLGRQKTQLTIGPNPASEALFMEVPFKANCSITTLTGTTIWTRDLESGHQTVDIHHFPPGLYFVALNGVVSGRFTKE